MLFHTSTLCRHKAFYDISRKRVRVMSALTRSNQDNAYLFIFTCSSEVFAVSARADYNSTCSPHPWIKPASGTSPRHKKIRHVFSCLLSSQPSGIWIFTSFKLGTDDTRRILTKPGKSQIDKTVLLKLFSFISCCEFY